MSETKHTPGPWEYVPSTNFHGPYVTSEFGSTICDCYLMSHPNEPSEANGGRSKPILHLHEMANPNARLIAAAPELLEALKLAREYVIKVDGTMATIPPHRRLTRPDLDKIEAAIAKATGAAKEG